MMVWRMLLTTTRRTMNNVINAGLRNAIEKGDLDGVRSQVGHNININADFLGWTYLHWAAFHGHVMPPKKQQQKCDGISILPMPLSDDPRIVEELLSNGACPHAKDLGGRRPVDIAKEREFPKIVRVLEAAMSKACPPQN